MPQPTAHHAGLTVAALEPMVAFYTETFDLTVAARFEVEGEEFETAVDRAGASAEIVHLDADGARIELAEYSPADDERDDPQLDQPGATHVGLAVDDVDAFFETLPDDVETLSDPQTTSTGTRIGFLRDPEGNLVEILDPDAE